MQSAESQAARRAASLRRLHGALGLLPLGTYLLFHAWEHWPVRAGRDALFARLSTTQHGLLELLFVLLPLLVHAGLGGYFVLRGEQRESRGYASSAFRRLQAVTGALSGAYLTFHLATSWSARLLEPSLARGIFAAYMATLEWTGTAPLAALHALGIAAVCTHFGQGVGVALPRFLPRLVAPRAGRVLGIALGAALWLAFLNELASYATAAPLL